MQITRRNLLQAGMLGATAAGLGAFRVSEAAATGAGRLRGHLPRTRPVRRTIPARHERAGHDAGARGPRCGPPRRPLWIQRPGSAPRHRRTGPVPDRLHLQVIHRARAPAVARRGQARPGPAGDRLPALAAHRVEVRADHRASPADAFDRAAGRRRHLPVGPGARAPGRLRAGRALPLQQRDVRHARYPRLDAGWPRASGTAARAHPGPARHACERAGDHARRARAAREELRAIPVRSALSRATVAWPRRRSYSQPGRRMRRRDCRRHGQVRAHDREPRPAGRRQARVGGRIQALLEPADRGGGLRAGRALWLRHRGGHAGRQPPAAAHGRHGVVHVGADGRHRRRHRRLCLGQRATGLPAEPGRALRHPADARTAQVGVAAGHAGTGLAGGRQECRRLRRHVPGRARPRSKWSRRASGCS